MGMFDLLTKKKSTNSLETAPTEVSTELTARRVYVQCPACKHVTEVDKLKENLEVCPRCGHHLRLNARQRLDITIDSGSFEEWDRDLASVNFLHFPGYDEKLHKAQTKTGEEDAVVCGSATIATQPCALFIMNGDFMMGSMGSVVGEKISRCFERATKEHLPVVGFTVSGGARMQEGTTSLMQMAKVSCAVRRHSDAGLLYIAVLTDPTSGGVTASFAMQADITLAEPGALVAFAGPRVIEQTIHRKLPPGFQSAEFQLAHGFVDAIVARGQMRETLHRLLELHAGMDGADSTATANTESEYPSQPSPVTASSPKSSESVAENSPRAYDRVRNARSTRRATTSSIISRVFNGFIELHGDRRFADDAAVIGGLAWLGTTPVTVIGTERGSSIKERVERNFGSAHPEGYRKALRLMQQAQKFGRPIVCFIDTSGAYCGIEAEERGQGQAIAENLFEMAGLTVPMVSIVIGEGGSGGALALGMGNEVWMLENAVYSVISPEGCASILYKDASKAPDAAEALGLTAHKLKELGIVDRIVNEHAGDVDALCADLQESLAQTISELKERVPESLAQQRYERFRKMGVMA